MNTGRFSHWLVCLWLAGTLGAVWAQALPDGLAELRIDVLRDPGAQRVVTELPELAAHFTPLPGKVLNVGHTRDVFWLRLSVRKHAAATDAWRLEIPQAFLDDLRLYSPDDGGGFTEQRLGDRLPFSARVLPYHKFVFVLGLPDAAPRQFYLRVQSTSTLVVMPIVQTSESLRLSAQKSLMGLFLYFGILLALLGINLAYAVWMRDRIFYGYALFIAAALLAQASAEGVLAQVMFPDRPAIPDILTGMAGFVAFGTGLLVFGNFLSVRRHFPRLNWVLVACALFEFLVALSPLVDQFVVMAPPGRLAIAIGGAITLAAAIKETRAGMAGAVYIACAYLIHISLVVTSALTQLGLIDFLLDPFKSLMWAMLIQLILFQIGIIVRTHQAERAYQALVERAGTAQERADSEQQSRETQGQFLTMVAHEVRTPLAVITASTNALRLVTEAPPHVAERLDRIERSVQRMSSLFDLCLNVERIAPTKDKPQFQPVSLFSLIAKTAAEHELEPGKRLKIRDETRDREIQADPRLLKVALSNLLENAAKYSPPDAPIEVRIHVPEPEENGPGIAIDVIDGGPGVPLAVRERIFEKYFRAEELNDVSGLGLGLYLTRCIVESHGGHVRVLDGPGGRFRIYLPPGG